eukprot:scaffold83178_cov15-Tisochrysis_lutea.AAC.1
MPERPSSRGQLRQASMPSTPERRTRCVRFKGMLQHWQLGYKNTWVQSRALTRMKDTWAPMELPSPQILWGQ